MRKRLVSTWQRHLRDEHDYIAHPKQDGYRALHVVVERDGRLIEIQLRTQLQHLWAAHVEKLEMARREVLRRGLGEASARTTLRDISDALAQWEERQEGSLNALLGLLAIWVAKLEEGR